MTKQMTKEIEALEEAVEFYINRPEGVVRINDESKTAANAIMEAAVAYLQLLKGEHDDFRAMRNLVAALLPMAKGYAHENPVGRNQAIVREVNLRFQELDEKYFAAQEGQE